MKEKHAKGHQSEFFAEWWEWAESTNQIRRLRRLGARAAGSLAVGFFVRL